ITSSRLLNRKVSRPERGAADAAGSGATAAVTGVPFGRKAEGSPVGMAQYIDATTRRMSSAGTPEIGGRQPACRPDTPRRMGGRSPLHSYRWRMGFEGLSSSVVIVLAAVLWLVYLVPTWLRRREYLSTERNAVRLQQ